MKIICIRVIDGTLKNKINFHVHLTLVKIKHIVISRLPKNQKNII